MAFEIEAAPARQTSDGQPGAWYWPNVQGAHALIARKKKLLAYGADADPVAVAEACLLRVEDCRRDLAAAIAAGVAEIDAALNEAPHVRILPLTNRELSQARSKSTVLQTAFNVDSAGAIRADPITAELAFQKQLVRKYVPEARNFVGVLIDEHGDRERIELTDGAALVSWVERTSNPSLDVMLGDIASAIIASALLERGMGEASASPRAG